MADSQPVTRFQFDHTYDSAGNRTALAISGNLYSARSFGYTFNAWGNVTQVTENVNLNNYVAAVTSDANGNITGINETWNGQDSLVNTFEYDFENRLVEHDCASVGVTVEHKYDGLGRLVRTDRTVAGPTTMTFEHIRDGLKVVGNIDATNTNTAPTWTNHPNALKPVESQQLQTNSAVQFINVSDEITPARRTYNPSTSAAGDTSAIASKGRLVLVNGSLPAMQQQSTQNASELFSQRNMTYNENSIALSSDRGTLELSGVNLMYEGTRVKSWLVGRDLNPAGRGDGSHYALGGFEIGALRPPASNVALPGTGNSVNNGCALPWDKDHGGGGGDCIYYTNRVTCVVPGYLAWPPPHGVNDYGFGQFYSPCNMLEYHFLPNEPYERAWRVTCVYDPYCPYTKGYNDWAKFTHWVGCTGDIPEGDPPTGGWGQFPRLKEAIGLCSGCKGGEGAGCEECQGDKLDDYAKGNINFDSGFSNPWRDRDSALRSITDKLAKCLDCMIKNGLWESLAPVYSNDPEFADVQADISFLACLLRMFTTGQWYISEARNIAKFGDNCCCGDSVWCCGTTGYAVTMAIACNCPERGKYTMICDAFWKLSKCQKMMYLIHEAMHFCISVPGHKIYSTGAYNRVASQVVECCFPGCAEDREVGYYLGGSDAPTTAKQLS